LRCIRPCSGLQEAGRLVTEITDKAEKRALAEAAAEEAAAKAAAARAQTWLPKWLL